MLHVETIEGTRLAGNLLGNETARPLVVHLPDGYSETSGRRYPTVYLLHGYVTRALSWTQGPMLSAGTLKPPIGDVVADAVARFDAGEVILVMPDGWSRFGCSQWVDSPVTGRFEQYVSHDVVAHVDATYRTIPEAAARGIMGISSGGFGAWHLATRHPDVFGAAALLSADALFEVTQKPFFYRYFDRLQGKAPSGPIDGDINSYMCYGLSQAYSPDLAAGPFHAGFPIDHPSGDVIEERWRRWLELDPVVSWEPRLEQIRRLRGLLLDVGANDEHGHHYGHRVLSRRLSAAGIAHDVEEHDGTHTSRMFERIAFALGWLSGVLAA